MIVLQWCRWCRWCRWGVAMGVGLGSGRVGWSHVVVNCESGLFV